MGTMLQYQRAMPKIKNFLILCQPLQIELKTNTTFIIDRIHVLTRQTNIKNYCPKYLTTLL